MAHAQLLRGFYHYFVDFNSIRGFSGVENRRDDYANLDSDIGKQSCTIPITGAFIDIEFILQPHLQSQNLNHTFMMTGFFLRRCHCHKQQQADYRLAIAWVKQLEDFHSPVMDKAQSTNSNTCDYASSSHYSHCKQMAGQNFH
eukprot:scaffold134018_cov20-Prasinocladus_malaysianus.AAC.1